MAVAYFRSVVLTGIRTRLSRTSLRCQYRQEPMLRPRVGPGNDGLATSVNLHRSGRRTFMRRDEADRVRTWKVPCPRSVEVGRMFGTGFGGGMGAGGWVLMIGVWTAFLALTFWALARMFPAGRPGRDARVELDRRPAGEIDPDTYRAVRDELAGAGRQGQRS